MAEHHVRDPKSTDPVWIKAVEEALKTNKRLGVGVSSKIEDKSELFFGEYIDEKSIEEKLLPQDKKIENEFIDRKAYYYNKDESQHNLETKCEVLTLNNPEDLLRFNHLLNAKNDKQSKIQIQVLEKQYNAELKTWQVFVIYVLMQPSTLIKK